LSIDSQERLARIYTLLLLLLLCWHSCRPPTGRKAGRYPDVRTQPPRFSRDRAQMKSMAIEPMAPACFGI
jgi:hypothetical protein